ncbi:cob(I)yrinic acid a,c-diamide adenosyltransferase [Candidatus Peregrinibacteria bacterium]|nr:cob(I)yrinic acid a,c-diamide adenosyltransferase [Candidatus Peregrinibacteria bacterium]
MILVFTGNGKGKTTAALGAALRSAGQKKKTAVVFFDKGGEHYGEQKMLERLEDSIDIFRFGKERFDPKKKTFRFGNLPEDREEAKKASAQVLKCSSADYFLIVCDEIISCLDAGLLTDADVRAVIEALPATTYLILTGRHAPGWLIEKADLVTEMKEKKHYFKKGWTAIEGLEY